jgi:uncharacterized protein (UPF0335 family)
MTHSHEAQKLKQFVEKIERLESEKKEIGEEVSGIYRDLGNEGFDVPAIKEIVRSRKKNKKKQMEQEALVDYYKSLLGDLKGE